MFHGATSVDNAKFFKCKSVAGLTKEINQDKDRQLAIATVGGEHLAKRRRQLAFPQLFGKPALFFPGERQNIATKTLLPLFVAPRHLSTSRWWIFANRIWEPLRRRSP
jgi:hypothetical protein